ncbi:MAG TPA: serine/threonine-protein kinase [Pirellulaceae bacterium]|nr:serine/threonine-protein kinase [Pirellulaceae bacterium]
MNSQPPEQSPDQVADDPEVLATLSPAADTSSGNLSENTPREMTAPRRSSPHEFPGYAVEGVLGEGGMGIVYRARHLRLDRPVAIKAMLTGGYAGPDAIQRMLNEIDAIAHLHHPNIVQILDSGQLDGLPYYVMELVDGGHLGQRLTQSPPTYREAAEIIQRLARAMHYAHEHGVIHRDLKPSNVLLTVEGDMKVTDFGIAKRNSMEHGMTVTGAVLGTPGYLSPEQAEGKPDQISPASDVFAMGVMLYEMIAGRRPFDGTSEMDILSRIIYDDPPSPAWFRPGVPRDLETICLKCLHKRPHRRYPTAAELADDLGRFLNNQVILARRTGLVERAVKWCRRHPARATLIITLAIAIPAVIVGLTIANRQLSQALARSQRLIENNSGLSKWIIQDHLKKLDNLTGAADAQYELALRLKEFLEVTQAESETNDELLIYLANAYENVADVLGGAAGRHLGRPTEAVAAYQVAIGILQQLRKSETNEELDALYARCLIKCAGVLWQTQGIDAANRYFDEAEPLVQAGLQRNRAKWLGYQLALSQNRFEVASTLNDLEQMESLLIQIEKMIGAEGNLEFGATHLSRDTLIVWTASNRGALALRQGDLETAQYWHQRELETARQAAAARPGSSTELDQLVTSLVHMSDVQIQKDVDEAHKLITEAEQIAAQLHAQETNNVYYLSHWALVLERLQRIEFQRQNFERSLAVGKKCAEQRQRIADIDPNNLDNRRGLRAALSSLADIYFQIEKLEDAEPYLAQALELAKPLAEAPNAEPADLEGLAETYLSYGAFMLKKWVETFEYLDTPDILKAPQRKQAEDYFRLAAETYDQITKRIPLSLSQQSMRNSVDVYTKMIADIVSSLTESIHEEIF